VKKFLRIAFCVLVGITCSWVSMRATRQGVRVRIDPADALCVAELAPGQLETSADFKTSAPLDSFKILVVPQARKDLLRLSITSGDTLIFSATVSGGECGAGRDIQPGIHRLVVEQDSGGGGGKVYVSERPLGMTGWQVYSRVLVVILVLSGVWALAARKSKNAQHRLASRATFHYLLLALVLIFVYLLFHEGGHALFAILFGKFSLADSDFWGISGHPSSGLKLYAEVEPWQRALVSFAGPAIPTLVGWVLFSVWISRSGRRLREARPVVNLYFTALALMCVFPFIVVAGQLLGMLSDGDWRGFINNVPGPLWLVKTVLWTAFVFNVAVIVRVAIELRQVWRAHIAALTQAAGAGKPAAMVHSSIRSE